MELVRAKTGLTWLLTCKTEFDIAPWPSYRQSGAPRSTFRPLAEKGSALMGGSAPVLDWGQSALPMCVWVFD
jgi:hypothetical protein